MKKSKIGDRMKSNYESRYRVKLTRRTPVILRLDGKTFHTLTRGCEKPFSEDLHSSMINTTYALCEEIQGAKCAYSQSDEISILLVDFNNIDTDAWFDYNLQKIVSVSAGIASTTFTMSWGKTGIFDCRAFNIPKEEVCNYFVWRQQDWFRNSVQMLARAHYSHKQLYKKNLEDIHEMLHEKGINWNDLGQKWKNGTFLSKIDRDFTTFYDTIFTEDRPIVEKHLEQI